MFFFEHEVAISQASKKSLKTEKVESVQRDKRSACTVANHFRFRRKKRTVSVVHGGDIHV